MEMIDDSTAAFFLLIINQRATRIEGKQPEPTFQIFATKSARWLSNSTAEKQAQAIKINNFPYLHRFLDLLFS